MNPETPFANPCGWPEEILPLVQRAYTCEYASLTRAGQPLTYPVTPHLGDDGRTIDVATGLAYPLKAERARHNPKVCLLFSEPKGTGLENAPVVRVFGLATVKDADLQANTDRYLALSLAKFAAIATMLPKLTHEDGTWYYARIWICVTPTRIEWWPQGDTSRPPAVWTAPEGTAAAPSDPPPRKAKITRVFEAPADWTPAAQHAIEKIGSAVLSVPGADGFPMVERMASVELTETGFALEPVREGGRFEGAACVTFHSHPEIFTAQENIVFVGVVRRADGRLLFDVERQVGAFSLGRNINQVIETIFARAKSIKARLEVEAERRGQPVPVVNMPEG